MAEGTLLAPTPGPAQANEHDYHREFRRFGLSIMSIQDQQAVTRSFNSERHPISRSLTEDAFAQMLGELECGQLVVDTLAGDRVVFAGDQARPACTI